MSRPRVAIVGASGYTGAELLRLLAAHPGVTISALYAARSAGQRLPAVFPQFAGRLDLPIEAYDPERVARDADVVFCALPHGESAAAAGALVDRVRLVLDLSGDLRLHDPAEARAWYGDQVPAALLGRAVYGLPELHRERLRQARLVAVPGCYPTASVLALAPLLGAGLVARAPLVIDAKSGVSGAGRNPTAGTHFCEVGEGARAYKVGGVHRHIPEIEQELGGVAGAELRVAFTPHLLPMTRGILVTAYATPTDAARPAAAYAEALRARYEGEPFVTVVDGPPDTAHVRGSNRAHVAVAVDGRVGQVIAMSAIDNLTKGASGQAVQCMNLALGLPETAGLDLLGVFP